MPELDDFCKHDFQELDRFTVRCERCYARWQRPRQYAPRWGIHAAPYARLLPAVEQITRNDMAYYD